MRVAIAGGMSSGGTSRMMSRKRAGERSSRGRARRRAAPRRGLLDETTRPRSMLNLSTSQGCRPRGRTCSAQRVARRTRDANCRRMLGGPTLGGHHSINSRVSDAARPTSKTLLRCCASLSQQLSAYNDFISCLSISNHSCNDIRGHPKVAPSYAQRPSLRLPTRTGWNTVARKHYRFNGSSPCVPSVNFTEWVQTCSQRQNAHLCSMPNVQLGT